MELNKDERRAVAKVNAELAMGSLNSGDYAAALTHIQRAVLFSAPVPAAPPNPKPVTLPGPTAAIPPGVYYSTERQNFYDFVGVGKGDAFYGTWYHLRAKFPTQPKLVV